MKKTYKSIIFSTVGLSLCIGINAQNPSANDTVLNRQVLLEREYNPTLQDASKINTQPAIHEPVVKPANVQFETKIPSLSFSSFPIGDTGSGDIKTNIQYDKKRGYLSFNGGTYANLDGALGVKAVDTKTDQLDIFARHLSTNGNIKYAEKGYNMDKAKAKFMDNFIKATYQHQFEPLTWYLNASYQNLGFNYYGNTFNNDVKISDKTQTVNTFGVETGVKSNNSDEFKYVGFVKYNHFSTKYGPSMLYDGVDGNILNAGLDIAAPFRSDYAIGVDLGLSYHTFGDVTFGSYHEYAKLKFNPYFNIEADNLTLSLGVEAHYAMDDKNKLVIAPDINLSWIVADRTSLYANIGGGINDNNYLYIMQENRYIDQTNKVKYSQTLFDAQLGVKSGNISGFEFDIFGGYKYTKDEHLYTVNNNSGWGNVSRTEYYNLGTGHIGGLIKTSLIPLTDLSAKLVTYFYNVDGDDYEGGSRLYKAWNRPTATFDLSADVTPFEKLILSANYNLATGRKAEFNGSSISMKNINELNFGGTYQLFDWLSLNARLNNVLNQKYDMYYGYTQQGFNVMGGATLKF